MKLTYRGKVEIYSTWKRGESLTRISRRKGLALMNLKYMVRLADRHGIEILRHRCRSYSLEFKESAVRKAMHGMQSVNIISLEFGLPSRGHCLHGLTNTGKTAILSLKGSVEGMASKARTAKEYEAELKELRQQIRKLTIENEYIKN